VKAAERAERDADVLRLFMAGATYAQIARAVSAEGDKITLVRVDQIVKRELAASARRRTLLTDEALAVHQERQERLFQAHWGPALKGDHRSAEICRKMLDQNARLYGLYADALPSLPAPTPTGADEIPENVTPANELERLRAARSGA
jgi:hypothetical protein